MESAPAPAIGFTFRETMAGHVGAGQDYADGHASGMRTGEHLRFRVAVRVADFKAFLADDEHEAGMDGTIDSASLGDGLTIEGGSFKLFARDSRGHRTMQYRLPFTTGDGTACLLEGFKDVHNDRTFDFWYDTTALFTSLHAPGLTGLGDEPFRGILRIRAIDLVPQVWSMRAVNTRNPGRHALVLGRFGLFFAGQMLDEYRPRLRKSRNGKSS